MRSRSRAALFGRRRRIALTFFIVIMARAIYRAARFVKSIPANEEEKGMDTQELYERGLRLRKEMFGEQTVAQRMNALGEFGAPLQTIINAYAYGDVWSQSTLPRSTRSLAMIAMMAAIGRTAELRVHLNGALRSGCTAEEIRDILLLVALYCGLPAGNEAHRVALDVLKEHAAEDAGKPQG